MARCAVAIVTAALISSCGAARRLPPQEVHQSESSSDSTIVKLIRQELQNADLVVEQHVVEYYPPEPDASFPDSAVTITPAVSEDHSDSADVEPPKIRNPTPAPSSQKQGAVRRTVDTKIRLQAVKSQTSDSTSAALVTSQSQTDAEVFQTKQTEPEGKAIPILRLVAIILGILLVGYIVIKLRFKFL